MSKTFKMPEPDSFKVDTEGNQFFTEFEDETIDALTNDRAVVTKLYSSEQVKEILEQCERSLIEMSTISAEYFQLEKSHALQSGAAEIRKIKEMVK